MLYTANDRVQHRPKVAIVTQMVCTLSPGLHDDNQRKGLREGIGFQSHRLWNAVVREDKIIGREREDKFAVPGLHKYGHKHQIRTYRERRNLGTGRCLSTSLRMGRIQ